jgi:hypothetical protein
VGEWHCRSEITDGRECSPRKATARDGNLVWQVASVFVLEIGPG